MTLRLSNPDGTDIGRFTFGTMQFGGRADAEQSRAMFDACRAAGITHFDTAYVYTDGASETLLGQMIASQRQQLTIATKAGYTGGAGAANIRAQFDMSRKRRVAFWTLPDIFSRACCCSTSWSTSFSLATAKLAFKTGTWRARCLYSPILG